MVGTRPLPTQSCNRIRDLSFSACSALAMHGRREAPNGWDEVENKAAVHGGSQLFKISNISGTWKSSADQATELH